MGSSCGSPLTPRRASAPRRRRPRRARRGPPRRPGPAGYPLRASIPTSRRVAVARSTPRRERSFLRTRVAGRLAPRRPGRARRARSRAASSSTPLRRSSWARARRARPSAALPALHPGPGERLVVDEADLGEAVEQPLGELVRARRAWPACRAAPGGCGPDRSAVEQDLAGHRLGVGVGTLRHRVRRCADASAGAPPVQAATPTATSPCQPTPRWLARCVLSTPMGFVSQSRLRGLSRALAQPLSRPRRALVPRARLRA